MKKNALHDIYLGLGSNLGDREKNIDQAVALIESHVGDLISLSSLYTTAPVGFDSTHLFLNAVCRVSSTLSVDELLIMTQKIEKELGRSSKSTNQTYSDRLIDIDLLLFDDQIIDLPHLVIPHPRLHERLFVLDPLAEIAPDKVHPLLKQMMKELKDKLAN